MKPVSLLFCFLLLLLLGGCVAEVPKPSIEVARGFGLVIPIYNDAGLREAETTLNPHLRADDRFMIVSGNATGTFNATWVEDVAKSLRATYPKQKVYAATSGLTNIQSAANANLQEVDGIIYIYEPNFPNQFEFSWEFAHTLRQFNYVSELIRSQGLVAIGKPTGRPLLQRDLSAYNWNYGELASSVDELFVQTQTYCSSSSALFSEAMSALLRQDRSVAAPKQWIPQVTIDPNSPNGTTAERAKTCLDVARAQGVEGAVLWWAPPYAHYAVDLISQLNAQYSGLQKG